MIDEEFLPWDNVEKADAEANKFGELSDIFEYEPVDLDTFIHSEEYLGEAGWDLSPIQYEAIRMIERIYFPELYPIMARVFKSEYWALELPVKNLLSLEWGKGSGKDMVCRIASLRVAYLLLCLRSPQEYFGIPSTDSIHLLNIAVNSQQAERAFFAPVRKAVSKGFFKGKARVRRDAIEYDKNIIAISGHSDAEAQEGLNIMLGVADEIDAFREQSEMINLGNRKREASTSAESILKMIEGSAASRFPRTYKRVVISYPRYLGSTIQQQTAKGKRSIEKYGENSMYYVSGPYATWEVNPRIKGKEDFAEKYAEDPVEAASMYECRPARAVKGYFQNMPAIRQAIDKPDQPISVSYAFEPMRSEETGMLTRVWNAKYHIPESFKPIQGARYAMHADLAISGDRAGIAMTHIEKWLDKTEMLVDPETNSVTESLVRVPILRNDFTIALSSSKEVPEGYPMREIQIRWARELCFELIARGFPIVLFSFDQFQSADSMQILNAHGIETDRISADINNNAYKALKDVAYDGRLHMPHSDLLLVEIESLNDTGKKVDHPPGGSKDLADALACSIVGAITALGEEDVDGKEVDSSENLYPVGDALAPLVGMNGTNMSNMMPLGMKGHGLYGN